MGLGEIRALFASARCGAVLGENKWHSDGEPYLIDSNGTRLREHSMNWGGASGRVTRNSRPGS